MRIIDNYTTTNGIKLTAVADNPVTITASCRISIDETAGSAVTGESDAGQPNYNFQRYIKNFGLISAAGSGSAGVGLFGGGTVVNEGGISGETQGIYAGYQLAFLNNYGSISGSGKGGRGILLADGGTGVGGVETWRLAGGASNTLSLTNANFAGTAAATIAVLGGATGNTLGDAGVAAADWAVLVGGAGADILTAGQHAKLTGGAGADQFVFTTPGTASSPDANTIADFARGLDKIVFRDAGFNLGADDGKGTATLQRIAPSLFSPKTDGSFAAAANRFAYDTKTGVLFYDADGSGGAHASQRIAALTNHPTLAAADLFFVK